MIVTVALFVAAAAWALLRVYNPRLGTSETERALPARIGSGERFECSGAGDGGGLSLADPDYVCIAADGWPMYAVATNWRGITAVEQFGGP